VSYTFAPSLYRKLPYDAAKDFKPITMIASGPLVHPSMPVRSLGDLLALARSRPGEIHYASAGVGSNIHLTASCGSCRRSCPTRSPASRCRSTWK